MNEKEILKTLASASGWSNRYSIHLKSHQRKN